MRRAVRQEQEERLPRIVFDKADGLTGKAPGQIALLNGFIECQRIPVQRLFGIVGLQQAVEYVEPVCVGLLCLRVMAQVPLTDQGCSITPALQQVRRW